MGLCFNLFDPVAFAAVAAAPVVFCWPVFNYKQQVLAPAVCRRMVL